MSCGILFSKIVKALSLEKVGATWSRSPTDQWIVPAAAQARPHLVLFNMPQVFWSAGKSSNWKQRSYPQVTCEFLLNDNLTVTKSIPVCTLKWLSPPESCSDFTTSDNCCCSLMLGACFAPNSRTRQLPALSCLLRCWQPLKWILSHYSRAFSPQVLSGRSQEEERST